MKKYGLAVVNIYFIMLIVVVILGVVTHFDIINTIYMIVVFCSCLKFNLILRRYKK